MTWQRTITLLAVVILSLIILIPPKPALATSLSWTMVYPSVAESTAIASPTDNQNTIYASIRKWTSTDILKSDDNGKSWISVKSNLPEGADINWISFDQRHNGTVLISEWGAGFFLSKNGGSTWEKINSHTEPRAIEPDYFVDNSYFIGGTANFGLHRATYTGSYWADQQLLSGGNTGMVNINYSNPQTVFADNGGAYYRSDNWGMAWTNLNFSNPGSTGNIIDGNTIFVGRHDIDEGVYKSIDNGVTWQWKNKGLTGKIYNFGYNKELSSIFVTRGHNQGGGIWRSKDLGESWENVSDPAWGSANTWGLEVTDKYVFVSVEGLGIYRAPLETAKPVVIIPGFAGSWSYKGLVENQPTVYSDWSIIPFADPYYQPLIQTLTNAGANTYVFAYDYRKSVADTAATLNTYLTNVVGKQANVVTHSMGSLVARYCFEKIPGCSAKIDKIVTAGGPHQGTIIAYLLWEGGQIENDNSFTKAAMEIALWATNLPYLTIKDIVQNNFPGVRDLLPTWGNISKNPVLESLSPASASFSASVTPLSGNNIDTYQSFTKAVLNPLEKVLGLWVDGKPDVYTKAVGDGTVLKTSAEISGAPNKYYSTEHKEYFQKAIILSDILSIFGLTGTPVTSSSNPTNFLSFIIHSPATISCPTGTNVDGKAIFITNPTSQNYEITLTGTGTGDYQVDSFYTNSSGTFKRTANGQITTGATSKVNYQNFDFIPSIESFKAKVRLTNNRLLGNIDAAVTMAVNDIRNNRNRSGAFNTLEKAHLDIFSIILTTDNATMRTNLKETADQILILADYYNSLYRTSPTSLTVNTQITRTQKSIDAKSTLKTLTTRGATNLDIGKSLQADANTLLSSGKNYQSLLLSRAASVLVN